MPDSRSKRLLDSALNALLATIDAAWWVKGPSAFIAELAARFGDLPEDQQDALAESTPEVLRDALLQLDLTSKHSAYSAAGVDRLEHRFQMIHDALQAVLRGTEPTFSQDSDYVPPLPTPSESKEIPKDTEHRIRRLLLRADRWDSWRRILNDAYAVHMFRSAHEHVPIYAFIDSGDVLTYLLPQPHHPTQLRVALECLFGADESPLFLLEPHAIELHERIRSMEFGLRHFLHGAQRVHHHITAALHLVITGLHCKPSQVVYRELAELIANMISPEEALSADKAYTAWTLLIHLFDSRTLRYAPPHELGITASYQPDEQHIRDCEQFFQRFRPDAPPRANHQDACALDHLRWLASSLPAHGVPILYTHSNAILSLVTERQAQDAQYLAPGGVPLVQHPNTVLVYRGLLSKLCDSASPPLSRHLMIARASSASATRERIRQLSDMHDRGPSISEQFLKDLEDRFDATATAFERLTRVAMDAMLAHPAHRPNPVSRVLIELKQAGVEHTALLTALDHLLDARISEVEQSQATLYLSVMPSIDWDRMDIRQLGNSVVLQPLGIVRGPVTDYVFHSVKVQEALRAIAEASNRHGASDKIHRLLLQYEAELRSEPEFYLLLAFVYSMSPDMWFQAYEAADRGLELHCQQRIAARRPHNSPFPEFTGSATEHELRLARATALGRWGLGNRNHVKVCSLLASAAIADLERIVATKPPNKDPHCPVRADYRCMRELSFIYCSAAEWDVMIATGGEAHAEGSELTKEELFGRAIRWAEAGLALAPTRGRLHVYLANNLLYALLTKGALDEQSRMQCEALVNDLRDSVEHTEDAAVLDTLQVYYTTVAAHEEDPVLVRDNACRAQEYMERAMRAVTCVDEPAKTAIENHALSLKRHS